MAQHGAGRPERAGDGEPTASPAVADQGAAGSPTILFTCSLTGTVRAVNESLSRMSGRPLADLPGAPVHTLLHPSCHPRILEVLRDARGGATSGIANLCLRRVDGSWVQLATAWSVLSDAMGDVAQVVFVDADGAVGADQRPTAPRPTPDEVVAHRYAVAADLRTALATDSLHLEYQPIVDLESGALVGLEALARWTHPADGPVPPSSFVGAAELTGLAPALDRWVLRRALQDMAELRAAAAVPVSAYVAVNVSATGLADDVAFDDLQTWAEEFGVPAGQVVLEITETGILQDTEVAARLVRRLRGHGFQVALDDVGTGCSSLAHLRDLPISALKIDRSFVAHAPDEHDARALIASVVGLAHDVGVAVVAEGVETPEQLAAMRRLGVGTAQGWLWGPAVPTTALLRRGGWTAPVVPTDATAAASGATGRWKHDVSVAQGLRRLMELHQLGASVVTIAATLDDEGYGTPTGLPWQPSSVERVLAHQIRRCGGAPDPGTGSRRIVRAEKSNPPPS